MERYRISPPRPRTMQCAPLLDARALEIQVQVICGRLAADLNLLLDGYPSLHGLDAALLLRRASSLPRLLRSDILFAASGLFCHEYFFRYLTETGTQAPSGDCAAVLQRSFGSADSFFYIFREEAQRMQVGGFLWLCAERRTKRLRLLPLRGYETPQPPLTPVLALDLWEHAYITRYGNDRRRYADMFLRQLDWEAVGQDLGAL